MSLQRLRRRIERLERLQAQEQRRADAAQVFAHGSQAQALWQAHGCTYSHEVVSTAIEEGAQHEQP